MYYRVAGFSAAVAASTTVGMLHLTGNLNMRVKEQLAKAPQPEPEPAAVKQAEETRKEIVALIGDVGGTNVRLTLRKLDLETRTSTEIKPLTKIPSQGVKSFAEAIDQYLSVSGRAPAEHPLDRASQS